MDPAYYVAASSLKARSMQLEVVSNNLANSDRIGYKPEMTFMSVFNKASKEGRNLPLDRYVNDGTVLANRGVDMRTGNMKPTTRELDLATDGNAFFPVQTPQGLRVTRDGRFQLGPTGRIESLDGNPLLGKNGQPIQTVPFAGKVQILEDGTVQQAGETLARIDMRAYKEPHRLLRTGDTRFDPTGLEAAPAKGKVLQGYLEESSADVPTAMIDMIRLNRLFEMSMKVASTLTNDLDARSINDIAMQR